MLQHSAHAKMRIYRHIYVINKIIKESFWVTNISKMNVSLSDLNLTINAMSTVNLLDSNHYFYSKEQLENSALSGSIFKKRDRLVVRKTPPVKTIKKTMEVSKEPFYRKNRSAVEFVEETKFEELNIADDKVIEQLSETAEQDHLGKWGNK